MPPLGHDGRLFILPFDHRSTFRRRLGVGQPPSAEELATMRDAKQVIYEGFLLAREAVDVPREQLAVLVDEELGADIARDARSRGITLAMPLERSGQDVLQLEHGDEFGRHVETFDPDLAKVLVRWNPSDATEDKKRQAQELVRVGAWLHETGRRLLLELLVPAAASDLDRVDGDADRYDRELRPELTRRVVTELRDLGIEPDVWKVEGFDDDADAAALGDLVTDAGRSAAAVLVGGGADRGSVERRLAQAAAVPAYRGFAIGRATWGDDLDAYLAGHRSRQDAAAGIATSFQRFIDLYSAAAAA